MVIMQGSGKAVKLRRLMMTSEAYVFIDGLEGAPIICGFFKLNTQTGRGEFNYGKSYLARPVLLSKRGA